MEVLLKTVQVILALSLLVVVHEFGHFIFARLFKTRVEKFYMFFNPKFSLVKFKKFDGRWHCLFFSRNEVEEWDAHPESTEFGIGWVPFGGYCAISGMIDETTKKEDLAHEPQPWEFRTKPAWQRFFIMFGGVLFNFVLAAILYSAILFSWGESYIKNEDAVYGIAVNDLSYEMGFRSGDHILALDGKPVENVASIQADIICDEVREVLVKRGSETLTIKIDPAYMPAMLKSPGMFDMAFPFVIAEVPEGSINEGVLCSGDVITYAEGAYGSAAQDIMKAFKKYPGEDIAIMLDRVGDDGEMMTGLEMGIDIDSVGMIEVILDTDLSKMFKVTEKKYGLLNCVPAGISRMWGTITNYVKQLGLIFSPSTKAYQSVGSFIAIGRIFPSSWDWLRFWTICALLSIILGVMNLLPIPALDGGFILFLIFEMITGHKPSDKFMSIAETVGIVLLCALMLLAFGNDIRSLF